jgi:hypothetical protein
MVWVLLLVALTCWTVGIARLYAWILDRRDARIDANYRAARLVAVSKAEVSCG